MSSNAVRFMDGTAVRELGLTMYHGVVMQQFYNDRAFLDRSGIILDYKNVGAGTAHQWLKEADMPDAEYFTPGNEMAGQAYGFTQATIAPDDPIVSNRWAPYDQLKLAHWDALKGAAVAHARKVMEIVNKKTAIMMVLAARTAAETKTVDGTALTVHSGGQVTTRTGGTLALAYPASTTGAARVREDLLNQAQLYDEDNYPTEGRVAFLPPALITALQYDPNNFDRNLSAAPGDLATRAIGKLAGFYIVPTNTIPNTNYTDARYSKYNGDFRSTSSGGSVGLPAIITCAGGIEGKAPVGLVDAGGMISHAVYREEKLSTFTMAGMFVGLGILWPSSAGEVRVIA